MKLSVEACIATLRKNADSLSIECENEKDMKVVMQLGSQVKFILQNCN